MLLTLFLRVLSRVLVLIGFRNFSVLCTCHVQIIFVNVYFLSLDSVCEIISFSEPIYEEQHKIHGNKLILFEIVKTNNEMMS